MLNIRKTATHKIVSACMHSEFTVDNKEVKVLDSWIFIGLKMVSEGQHAEKLKRILGEKAMRNRQNHEA